MPSQSSQFQAATKINFFDGGIWAYSDRASSTPLEIGSVPLGSAPEIGPATSSSAAKRSTD